MAEVNSGRRAAVPTKVADGHHAHQRAEALDIVRLSGRQHEGDWASLRVALVLSLVVNQLRERPGASA